VTPPGFRGTFREDELARAVYSEAAGIAQVIPTAVAVPLDADDVVTLVRWAAATRTSLIPRGSGSSMAGGAIGKGVIVDLSRINRLGKFGGRTVWADPGVLWSTLDVAARRRRRAGASALLAEWLPQTPLALTLCATDPLVPG
jgi:FAD/FMN-containing dehydrogenase